MVQRTQALLVALPLVMAIPQQAGAQTTIHTEAAELTLSGRLHTQFNTTSADSVPSSEFVIRRARFDATVKINDFVSGFVQPEYAAGRVGLRVAYARLHFSPALQVTIGQYKRPFDVFTLTSSSQILVVERTGSIRGVESCSGIGGVCSYGQFMEQLQYSATDVGIIVEGSDPHGHVSYAVSAMNGEGGGTDQNSAKSFTGRLAYSPGPRVHIAANVGVHDYIQSPTEPDAYAAAEGADVEIGDFERGWHVQAGVVTGGNWLNQVNGSPSRFRTAQAIVTYRFVLRPNQYATAIEPVTRVSYGDPDTAVPGDGGLLLTPGLVWHIAGRNKMAANLDIWHPQQGRTAWGLKLQSYMFF